MSDVLLADIEPPRLALAQALRAVWDLHGSNPTAAHALAHWPAEFSHTAIATQEKRATRFLSQLAAMTAPATHEFVQILAASSDILFWGQTYTADQMSADFLDKYCWASLMGDQGLFRATGMVAAVMIIGPHTEYPRHRHNNPEVYLTLAGHAEWSIGSNDWSGIGPGTVVPVESNAWHGMRTGEQPLLVSGICLVENIRPSTMETVLK